MKLEAIKTNLEICLNVAHISKDNDEFDKLIYNLIKQTAYLIDAKEFNTSNNLGTKSYKTDTIKYITHTICILSSIYENQKKYFQKTKKIASYDEENNIFQKPEITDNFHYKLISIFENEYIKKDKFVQKFINFILKPSRAAKYKLVNRKNKGNEEDYEGFKSSVNKLKGEVEKSSKSYLLSVFKNTEKDNQLSNINLEKIGNILQFIHKTFPKDLVYVLQYVYKTFPKDSINIYTNFIEATLIYNNDINLLCEIINNIKEEEDYKLFIENIGNLMFNEGNAKNNADENSLSPKEQYKNWFNIIKFLNDNDHNKLKTTAKIFLDIADNSSNKKLFSTIIKYIENLGNLKFSDYCQSEEDFVKIYNKAVEDEDVNLMKIILCETFNIFKNNEEKILSELSHMFPSSVNINKIYKNIFVKAISEENFLDEFSTKLVQQEKIENFSKENGFTDFILFLWQKILEMFSMRKIVNANNSDFIDTSCLKQAFAKTFTCVQSQNSLIYTNNFENMPRSLISRA